MVNSSMTSDSGSERFIDEQPKDETAGHRMVSSMPSEAGGQGAESQHSIAPDIAQPDITQRDDADLGAADLGAADLGTAVEPVMESGGSSIIDVRAQPIEGQSQAKPAGNNLGNRTHRGREMFPDVTEVPTEYSALFQDYDSSGNLGPAPLWLDSPGADVEPRVKLPTLMIGGVVLTTFASGMALAQLHNYRQANSNPEPKTPADRRGDPAKTGTIADAKTSSQAATKAAAKAAGLASPKALRPDWLTPGTKATEPIVKTSTANAPKAKTKVAVASGLASSLEAAIPPLALPKKPQPSITILTSNLPPPISARPMLSVTALSKPQLFPARLSGLGSIQTPKPRPALIRAASRPVVRPVPAAAVTPQPAEPSRDRFSSLVSSPASSEPMKLRSVDEVMAERMQQSAANLRQRRAAQARSLDAQGHEFGYESLRTASSVAKPAAPSTKPGTETAQWQATNRVITTTASSAAIVASPGMATISMPALSISVQESLVPDMAETPSPEASAPSSDWGTSKAPQPPKAAAPEAAPQAYRPDSGGTGASLTSAGLAPATLQALGLELPPLTSSGLNSSGPHSSGPHSKPLKSSTLDDSNPDSAILVPRGIALDRTISSPQYSGIESMVQSTTEAGLGVEATLKPTLTSTLETDMGADLGGETLKSLSELD